MATKNLAAALMMSAAMILPADAADEAIRYTLEEVIPGSAFHGIHGISFTSDNRILAGSVLGRAIYEIDAETGETSIFIDAPEGMADDLPIYVPTGLTVSANDAVYFASDMEAAIYRLKRQ